MSDTATKEPKRWNVTPMFSLRLSREVLAAIQERIEAGEAGSASEYVRKVVEDALGGSTSAPDGGLLSGDLKTRAAMLANRIKSYDSVGDFIRKAVEREVRRGEYELKRGPKRRRRKQRISPQRQQGA